MMMRRTTLIVFSVFCSVWVAPQAFAATADSQETQKQQKEDKAAPKQKPASAAMNGCVDEQNGLYVLLDDRTMSPIANLEADGFPREGFAKHMGHKVTVRGTSSPNGNLPTFKVRSIETISETCAPQLH